MSSSNNDQNVTDVNNREIIDEKLNDDEPTDQITDVTNLTTTDIINTAPNNNTTDSSTNAIIDEIIKLQNRMKDLELSLISIPTTGYQKITSVKDGITGKYSIYSDTTNQHMIAKGLFINGNMVKGEKFGYKCSGFFVITNKKYPHSHWVSGSFNEAGLLEGYGKVYAPGYDTPNLVQKGLFSNGSLVKGECYTTAQDLLSSSFDANKLTDLSKFNNPWVIKKGEFVNGHLQKGEYYCAGVWYVGNFRGDFLYGEGEKYEGYTKTRLIAKGEFSRDVLINGKKWDYEHKKWIVGEFNSDGNLLRKKSELA